MKTVSSILSSNGFKTTRGNPEKGLRFVSHDWILSNGTWQHIGSKASKDKRVLGRAYRYLARFHKCL